MSDAPKLSLQEGILIRKAVIQAIKQAVKEDQIDPLSDATIALWIADQAVDFINDHLPSLSVLRSLDRKLLLAEEAEQLKRAVYRAYPGPSYPHTDLSDEACGLIPLIERVTEE